ncbi:MAG: trigger factor [Sulfuritalea sp.]|nr:trigger factor [Sulfuritalea sp.]
MQTNFETLSSLERRLTMAVPVDSIDREVDDRLRKLSRTVRMPGFRPGKVPVKLVAQQYGPQVRSEVIGEAVQKAFEEAVREKNLRVAGYPRIEPKQDATEAGKLAFSATFEIYPEFKLGDLSSARIERPTLTVGDAEVDHTLEILRKQRVQYGEVMRAAQSGDRVTFDFAGNIYGNEFAGSRASNAALVLGEGRMLPDFETGLNGIGPGESRTFQVSFPADYGAKEVAGKSATFEVTVKKVEQPKLPELDAEFARSLGVEDGDLVKMRAEVKANVEREVNKRIDGEIKQKVMQALLDSTQIELPKSLVEIEIQRLQQQARTDLESRGVKTDQIPLNPEVFEVQAKRRVALGLIVGEMVKEHGVAATPAQVRSLVDDYSQTYEQPSEVVKWFYSEAKRLAEFEGLALESNIVKWVLGNAKVEDKAVTFDELMGKAA